MKIGSTDDFPRGKLNPDDEGGLNIAIGSEVDCVRIDFGEPIAWIALPPDQALAFASLIVKHAMAMKQRG
ncbi:MAG TPA: hypothetical protein VGG86_20850 [Roseiarcus sp.]